MPPPAKAPLERVTLNLFAADCDAMRKLYGRGWTERVRVMVEQHIKDRRAIRETAKVIFDNE